ncbi:Acylamino-acid-releasing enzyme [Fulvivirga imtechensis AK7]|uniref:Acylamino-acid-releasing enzyme n=1 Tax=Fulvivirga imtechensis AK7 TaxID=1237149 RepID=L8JX98_9BACT|nr:S9 family peptidase [Fulvivirga imtechensis]ELR73696.1 Acylamino-acid-releasing enzyme [Fulvivirga imtechensis AK7]
MRSLYFFVVPAVLFACASQQKEEFENEKVKKYTIEQFMDNESVFGGSFSADKSNVLVTSNRSGIFNMYTVPTDSGAFNPVSQSDSSSIYAISYFPEDDRILFRMDNNGDEIFHIYMRDQEGQVTELTPDKGARAVFYAWAHDGKSFFYGYNKRDKRLMDVYEMDIETMKPELIYEMESGYNFGGISDDKKYMALTYAINTNDSDLYLYNFETKEKKKINQTQSGNSAADFGVNSDFLYYLTDAGSEFSHLMKYDMKSGSIEKAFEADWDVSFAYFSHGGKYQLMLINADGKNEIRILNTETNEVVEFPTFESGDITSVNISRDESMMSFYVGSSSTPSNLYVYDIGSGAYRQLINTLNSEIDKDDLVTAEVVRYESFDGVKIPAIYYKPKQASADAKVPALVWVHGGPGGQSRQGYSGLIQYLVNHGYAVLAVNNRGSSGYGKTFYQMDDQRHGEEDLKDCVEGKNWLAEQESIDGERIGIIGGSYGGFMVMAALTRTPEAFDVGVNIFGVTNWLRTLRSIPPWWESFKDALYKEMGDPNTADSVRLYEISPLFHTENVTKPLMVLQGSQDPRVLQVESDEIVAEVKKNNVPVEYVLFQDEGHGFAKKDNQIEAYGKILEFLDQYLKEGKGQPVDRSEM